MKDSEAHRADFPNGAISPIQAAINSTHPDIHIPHLSPKETAIVRPVLEESERLSVYQTWPDLPPRIQQAIVLLVKEYEDATE